jgi:hypothetical protein
MTLPRHSAWFYRNWNRTRGHPFDEFGRARKAECLRKLEQMCEAQGYTPETIPSLRLGPKVASLRSYMRNGGREYMRLLGEKRALQAQQRGGRARQQQEREHIADDPNYKPSWQRAAEQHSLNAKLRREERERCQLGLGPKPRKGSTDMRGIWEAAF